MSFLKGLYRRPDRGVIAGVLAGIAEYMDWNVRLLRVAVVVIFLFSGAFPIVFVYAILWYVMEPIGGHPAPAFDTHAGDPTPSAQPPTMHDLKARFSRLEARLGYMEDCVTTKEFELRQELKKLEGNA